MDDTFPSLRPAPPQGLIVLDRAPTSPARRRIRPGRATDSLASFAEATFGSILHGDPGDLLDEDVIDEYDDTVELLKKKRGHNSRPRHVPAGYTCVLTGKVMVDPVLLAADGHSYEREALELLLAATATTAVSPTTGVPLAHLEMVPNKNLRERIDEWRRRSGPTTTESGTTNLPAGSHARRSRTARTWQVRWKLFWRWRWRCWRSWWWRRWWQVSSQLSGECFSPTHSHKHSQSDAPLRQRGAWLTAAVQEIWDGPSPPEMHPALRRRTAQSAGVGGGLAREAV